MLSRREAAKKGIAITPGAGDSDLSRLFALRRRAFVGVNWPHVQISLKARAASTGKRRFPHAARLGPPKFFAHKFSKPGSARMACR
jgi:hypothetical protein